MEPKVEFDGLGAADDDLLGGLSVSQPLHANRVGPGGNLEDAKQTQFVGIDDDDRGLAPEKHDLRPVHGGALVVADSALDCPVLRGKRPGRRQKEDAREEHTPAQQRSAQRHARNAPTTHFTLRADCSVPLW